MMNLSIYKSHERLTDQPAQLAKNHPKMSKAIAIINPESRQRQPIPFVPKPASTMSSSRHPSSKGSNVVLMPSMPLHTKNLATAKPKEDSISDSTRHFFDVYARPFVPEALAVINTLNGDEINTPAMIQLDFGAYVRSYVGLDFLPLTPQLVNLPVDTSFVPTDEVVYKHYERYFRYHLEAEIQSQQQENESYSLYGHDLDMLSCDPGQLALLSFLVPGLRENSPYIEEDDIIQLRQLRCDHGGRVLGMEHWLAHSKQLGGVSPGSFALANNWRGNPAPGWTGIVYNARVVRVDRRKEQLFVKVSGFPAQNTKSISQPADLSNGHLKFNVQFPVPLLRYLPMQQVLPIIQGALREASGSGNQSQDTGGASNKKYTTFPKSSSPSSLKDHHWLQSILFPSEANSEMQQNLNAGSFTRPFFDNQLNWEQKKAIESICSQNYGTLPFLISGPPGTGKTKTLIETALQLINNIDNVSHILFCAPSDPAADTLIQRLKPHLEPVDLLRLNRPSRTFAEVSDAVLPFCYISQNKFSIPQFKKLMSYKIVVTTCSDAYLLMYSRMTNSDLYAAEYGLRSSIHPFRRQPSLVELHWNALIIDEAAQAIEPEALIPLLVVAPPLESIKLAFKPLFVMAGDEHQLGPRTSLHSSLLKTSLFARLFARSVYADHPLSRGRTGKVPPPLNRSMLPILRPAFANLIRNYRSHPAILAVPSALFYADTLEPEGTGTDVLASWSEWRGKRWPVLFHNNDSEDDLQQDGSGWYNVGEAQIARWYAANLVRSRLVGEKDVCIMSPFKAQVQYLRKIVREQQLWEVDVGPTEAFQGLERGVVILCTTRSKERFVKNDMALNWGIIGMPNQMNVALTRAKFGLVVIGNRQTLLKDPYWEKFLGFCDRNGLVTDRQLTRLEKVLLARDGSEGSRVLRGVIPDDEMWTSNMTEYE